MSYTGTKGIRARKGNGNEMTGLVFSVTAAVSFAFAREDAEETDVRESRGGRAREELLSFAALI